MTSFRGAANRRGTRRQILGPVPAPAKKKPPQIGVALMTVHEQCLFFGNERQQTDKSSTQNGTPHSSLIQSCRPCASARENPALAVNQRSQCLQVLVVHVHRTRNHTVPRKLTAHLFLFQTSTTFAEFLQICAGNCCHEATYTCENITADFGPVKFSGVGP
jgi:hypothetical protein